MDASWTKKSCSIEWRKNNGKNERTVQGGTPRHWTTLIRCLAGACLQTWETCVKVVPEWEGELELRSVDEAEKGENAGLADEKENCLEDFLKQVIESPLWGFGVVRSSL